MCVCEFDNDIYLCMQEELAANVQVWNESWWGPLHWSWCRPPLRDTLTPKDSGAVRDSEVVTASARLAACLDSSTSPSAWQPLSYVHGYLISKAEPDLTIFRDTKIESPPSRSRALICLEKCSFPKIPTVSSQRQERAESGERVFRESFNSAGTLGRYFFMAPVRSMDLSRLRSEQAGIRDIDRSI